MSTDRDDVQQMLGANRFNEIVGKRPRADFARISKLIQDNGTSIASMIDDELAGKDHQGDTLYDQVKKALMGVMALFLAFLLCGQASAQAPAAPAKVEAKVYPTGRKVDPVKMKAAKEAARKRNGYLAFPKVTAKQWDCEALGFVGPVKDQSNCGSCWDFSGTEVVECALYKAGQLKNDGDPSHLMSTQYTLDCYNNGGCNGDDNTTVLDHAKKVGLPTEADYGPYNARPGRCKSGVNLLKIQDWGFCDGGQGDGVTSTDQIKQFMVQFGPIGCAVAADSAMMNCPAGTVFSGNARGINHDVLIIGWDDTKGRNGAWKVRNSWGKDWCDHGNIWMEYGANQIGTEAVWASAAPIPPPPPGPTPPTPPPGPTPPVPGTAPSITSALTASGSVGANFSYQISASNNPTTFGAAGLPADLRCDAATGAISGTPKIGGTFSVIVSASNGSGVGVATLSLVVAAPNPPAPGAVTITLTPEQVKAVISQAGPQELLDELQKRIASPQGSQPKCCGQEPPKTATDPSTQARLQELDNRINAVSKEIAAVKRGVKALLEWAEAQK